MAARAIAVLLVAAFTAGLASPGSVARPRIRVVSVRFLSFAPLSIAAGEGFFAEQGLDVELVPLARSHDTTPALMRGELDVSAGMLKVGDFNAIARGARVRMVADKGHFEDGGCVPAAFAARPGFFRKGEDEAARLRGARVASNPMSYMEFALETFLTSRGLRLADIRAAKLSEGFVAQAFQEDALDVGELAEPSLSRATRSGKAVIWKPVQEILPGSQLSVLLFGPRLLDRDRDAGRRFMVAYLKAVRRYNEGKTARNLALLSESTGLDVETLTGACWQPIREDGRIDLPSVMAFQRWAVGRGVLEAPLAPERFWDPAFVDEAARVLNAKPGS